MEYIEDLNIPNETCPPPGAVSGKFLVYRLVDNIPIKVEDIWSYRSLFPEKVSKVNECILRACSVFTDCKDLLRIKKSRYFNMKKIVVIEIEEKDGVLLKTFEKSHFSWWISKEFKLTMVKEVV